MSNRNIMMSALNKTVFPELKEMGFEGKHPNFRRRTENCVELITFQTNKWGGSFLIEVSAVFPGSENDNLDNNCKNLPYEELDTSAAKKRYRLDGTFESPLFFYSDVYKYTLEQKLFFGLFAKKTKPRYDYIPEKDADNFVPPEGWELVQKFDENCAMELCKEIDLQFEKAFEWLENFKKSHK